MAMLFSIKALPGEHFEPLFSMDEPALAALGARRIEVDESPGYPCRVSLVDASVGERVVLSNYCHHDVMSPYRASGPVYVREGAVSARPGVNEVPEMLRHRLLSIRGYSADAMLVSAEVADGSRLEEVIGRLFAQDAVAYLHLHNAGPGCYNCSVARA